jgi:hypothetical protein
MSNRLKPTPASKAVAPAFVLYATDVLAKEEVIAPFLIPAGTRIWRAGGVDLATAKELVLISGPAPGAVDQQHRIRC